MFEKKGSGDFRWISLKASPIYDSLGNPRYAVCVFRDITYRKTTEEELVFEKTLLEAQSEASIEGILVVGKDRRIMYANSRLFEITSIDKGEIKDMTADELIKLASKKIYSPQETIRRIEYISRLKTKKLRGEIAFRDGKVLSYYTVPVLDNGRYLARVWFFNDITEALQAERQREAFIGIATHEMKVPLATAKGYAELAAKKIKNRDGKHVNTYLTKITSQIDRVSNIVGDMLDMTKIRTQKLKLIQADFDIDTLINETLAIFKEHNPKRRFHKKGHSKRQIHGDAQRIRQVITNLISNALKYSEGKIIVGVENSRDALIVWVKDFGKGVPEDNKQKLFQIFFRGNETTSEGLGIGLFICKSIIKAHGGDIWLESKINKGSVFYFSLPFKKNNRKAILLG